VPAAWAFSGIRLCGDGLLPCIKPLPLAMRLNKALPFRRPYTMDLLLESESP